MLLNKWIKLLIIRLRGEKDISLEMKREIKNLLVLISLRISKMRSSILLSKKRLLGRVNRLEKLNHINDYKLISYNFNKNEMIRKSIISKLIINLLETIINGVNLKLKGSLLNGKIINNEIVISKPIIKENLSKVEIIFYYFIPNYKSSKWINRVNMFLSKLKSSKSLIRLNSHYNINNYKNHEKLLNNTIYNNIINIRNTNTNTNTNTNSINNNIILKDMLVKDLNDILLINNTNKMLELNNIEKGNLNIKGKDLEMNQIRNLHNKVEIKNLVSEYLLKNKLDSLNLNINNNNNNKIETKELLNNEKGLMSSMISSIDILLGNLNSKFGGNKLNMIISKYFGLKEVEIKGIHLKYEFNNTEILVKLIRKGVSKKTRTVSRMFRFRLRNRIPLLYDKGVLKNRINSSLVKNLILKNNILVVSENINNSLLNNNNNLNIDNNDNIYNDIKDYLNSSNKQNLNDNILYKNIVGWSLLLKGKVGGRKGKNRSTKIFIRTGSFKNTNLFVNNLLDPNSKSAYAKDRLKLNYIKNSNFISYVDKSTNNGKLGISLKLNIL